MPAVFLDKCSISGGKFVTAGLSFTIDSRDKSILITWQGYIRGLMWIAKQFVVFWDEGERRGWLVNGTSALLHLVRASLQHDKQSKFKSACVFNPGDLVEAQITHLPDSALEVLLNKKNRTLKDLPCRLSEHFGHDTELTCQCGGKKSPLHTWTCAKRSFRLSENYVAKLPPTDKGMTYLAKSLDKGRQ